MICADTSVLVPALVASHEAHDACHESAGLVDTAIAHVVFETFSVLTRLPQPYTVPAPVAAEAIRSYTERVIAIPDDEVAATLDRLAAQRIVGGAVYDAVIACTALHHEAVLLTRDQRALALYERLGVDVRWVAT